MLAYVYILASRKHGTLYTGVTSDLAKRVWQHREKQMPGFTRTYNVTRLVWYCVFDDITAAIAQEKRIKRWRRRWKIELIEKMNPGWDDLFDDL